MNKFLLSLKLQLFAADKEDDPEIGGQDDDIDTGEEEVTEEEKPETEETVEEGAEDDAEESEEENADEVTETDEEESEEEKPFMVFKSKEEHQKYMDNVIGKRLGEQRQIKTQLDEKDSLLDTFKQYFGVSDEEALKKKADELLDDIAYQRGTTKEELRKQQREQAELREFKAMQAQTKAQQAQQNLLAALTNDCGKLSKLNPDLYAGAKPEELAENKDFIKLLADGVPFKQAYDAMYVNIEDVIKAQKAKAKKDVIDDVKAKGKRITENATKKSKAGVTKLDVSKMSDAQIAELEERAANGEKIYL